MKNTIINISLFLLIATIAGVWIYYGYINSHPFAFVDTDYTPSQHLVESGFLGIVVSVIVTPIVRVIWLLYLYYGG